MFFVSGAGTAVPAFKDTTTIGQLGPACLRCMHSTRCTDLRGTEQLLLADTAVATYKYTLARLHSRCTNPTTVHLQDPRHDGQVREVASELGLVVGDALDADDALARYEVQDLVDQSERVSVRQHLEDVLGHREDGLRVGDALADVGRSRRCRCFLAFPGSSLLCHPKRGNSAS